MSTTYARWYTTGTIAVTNASATVTGTSTAWTGKVFAGDTLYVGGALYEIGADASSNTELTLAAAFGGTTASGLSYAIIPTSVKRGLASDVHARLSELSGQIGETYFGADNPPSDALGADGSRYYRTDVNGFYVKASGTWGSLISETGPAGADGADGADGTNGQGVPTGGTAGQLLLKSSGTDYDTAWSSYAPAGTGAVARAWQDKLRERRSVLDFIPVNIHAGIAAGTDTTNLTTYVQAALDAAASKGWEIFFPVGVYNAAGLELPSYVALRGEDRDKSVIRLASASNTNLISSRTYVDNESFVDIGNGLRSLTLDGNKANNSSGNCLVLRSYNAIVEDVIIQNAAHNGLVQSAVTINNSNGANAAEVTYQRVRVRNCARRGMWFYDNATSTMADVWLVDCWVHENGTDGYWQIEAERAAGFHLKGLQVYSDYAGNVKLANCARTMMSDCQLDLYAEQGSAATVYSNLDIGACAEGGILIVGSVFWITRPSGDVADSTFCGINLSSSSARVTIDGNIFYANGVTLPRAIHRSAASAAAGRTGPTNSFVGFSTAAQLGQGFRDTWRIGHGTLTPSSPVDVYDDSGFVEGRFRSGSNQAFIAADGLSAYVGTYQNIPLRIYQNSRSAIDVTASGIVVDGTIRSDTYTVATLPASPTQGDRAVVTDANATTFLSTVAGGGANVVPVLYNGSAWVIA